MSHLRKNSTSSGLSYLQISPIYKTLKGFLLTFGFQQRWEQDVPLEAGPLLSKHTGKTETKEADYHLICTLNL